ncbi:MAG: hypothetical protein WB646_06945 [Steroidobacteraceae bacterium]
MIGLAADERLTDEQLAHLAWHVAAVEPSELRHLSRLELPARPQQTCPAVHRQVPDDLDEILPLPHPLDYEWRFDPQTRAMLAQRCEQLAGAHGAIALLGTPTLAPALRNHAGDVLLLDANARLMVTLANYHQLGTIQWAVADLGTFSPPRAWQHRAAVVVCDPPWYPEGFATFLCAASALVRPGGAVLVSVPDVLTRPTVADELENLRHLAQRLRFDTGTVERCAVRYRTPFFEYRALAASGLSVIPLDWRAGTLWQLLSAGIAPPIRSGRRRASAAGNILAETTIDGVRLRVLHHRPILPGVLGLHPVIPGDILPTVSRRHPARGSATLWTSGNTLLSCADPVLAARLLGYLTDGDGKRLSHDRDRLASEFATRHNLPICDVRNTLDKLTAVVASERGDHAVYCAAVR